MLLMESIKSTQTYKEYVERQKRINLSKSFDNRIGIKENHILDINQRIEELEKQRKSEKEACDKLRQEKMDTLSTQYNDPKQLSSIVEYAEKTTFSECLINEIKIKYSNGINDDNKNLELLESIVQAEERINQEIKHTTPLGDLINNFGGTIKMPNEEDD